MFFRATFGTFGKLREFRIRAKVISCVPVVIKGNERSIRTIGEAKAYIPAASAEEAKRLFIEALCGKMTVLEFIEVTEF